MATFKGFDMAVGATILGIIVSGTIWYLDNEGRKQSRRVDKLQQEREQATEVGRYEQEFRMKLHNKLLDARSSEQLIRIERSLYWIEESPTVEIREIIVSFRKAIIEELKAIEETQDLVAEKKPELDVTKAIIEAMEQKNNEYEEQVEKNKKKRQVEFVQPKASATHHIQIKRITCEDPQSNWPKRCDNVYFSIGGKRIWKESIEICRGETIEFDKGFSFNTQSTIKLMEEDLTEDDLLDEFDNSKLEKESDGKWVIDEKSNKGKWRYVIEYEANSL